MRFLPPATADEMAVGQVWIHPALSEVVEQALLKLIDIRKAHAVFASGANHETEVLDVGNDHVFGYVRSYFNEKVVVLANFSEKEQIVSVDRIPSIIWPGQDLVSGEGYQPGEEIKLGAYCFIWLEI